MAGPTKAEAILIDFNSVATTAPHTVGSYSEDGMTVTSSGIFNFVHVGDNDGDTDPDFWAFSSGLHENDFVYLGGASFTLVQMDIQLNTLTSFTMGASTLVLPATSSPITFFFPAGFTGTKATLSGDAIIDNLVFNPALQASEPSTLLLFGVATAVVALRRRRRLTRGASARTPRARPRY